MLNEIQSHQFEELISQLAREQIGNQDLHSGILRAKSIAARAIAGLSSDTIVIAVEVVRARSQASAKLAHLGGEWVAAGYFTSQMIQQSTHPAIAAHHASRFAGCFQILELCTGAGFDTVALAKVAKRVVTYESSPIVAEFTRRNFALQGTTSIQVEVADAALAVARAGQFDGIWADPSRRTAAGVRVFDPDQYSPPLGTLFSLPATKRIGIKIGPGVNIPNLNLGWTREWIGYERECKEQILWFGVGVPDGTVTIVDGPESFSPVLENLSADLISSTLESCTGMYLINPHPALVRSGSLGELYRCHDIKLFDSRIAYGISASRPAFTKLVEPIKINAVLPFDLTKVKRYLKGLGWGSQTQLLKRGLNIEPETLRGKLGLSAPGASDDRNACLVFTRVKAKQVVIVGQRS